jgi:K+-transporting ATPase KdpF subunit
MSGIEWIGLTLTIGLVVYLVVALLYPERFQ